MNIVEKNRSELEERNYVLKADVATDYWFGLSHSKIDSYRRKFDSGFNIVIYGDSDREGDFYSIPFISIKDLLVSENLYKQNERERWVGDIKNHILRIRNSNLERNISQYYSLHILSGTQRSHSDEDINDYSIENAKREILVRIKQSKFRREVMKNFGYKCCITNISEPDLLVASHIVPWADKIETRLNPRNGLCLFISHDKLFDKGYFTLDPNLNIVVTDKANSLSSELQYQLLRIKGVKLTQPRIYQIDSICLEYHRDVIFEKHH